MVSSKPSTCDFHVWEMIDQHYRLYKVVESTKGKDLFEGKPLL